MTALIRPIVAACALTALALPPAAFAQPAERAPDSDETVKVARGTQLLINNFAGEVVVRGWDRDELRVQGEHSSRTRVTVRQGDHAVRVSASSSSGTSSVDYTISAPRWMPIRVTGTFNYIDVEGVAADISAETVRGDVRLKGGSGVITLKSIEGEVHVEDARGRINVSSVNEGVTLVRVGGTISAETVNGEIRMTDAKAESAEATTVNGDVRYTGVIADNGLYRFNTHNGDIVMGVQDKLNATVTVRSYNGDFRSSFAANAGDVRRGRRQTFTIGNGSAQIEIESFGGDLLLRRVSEMSVEREKKKND